MKRGLCYVSRILAVLLAACLLAGCSGGKDYAPVDGDGNTIYPRITMEMESGERMVFELYPDMAPNTVSNFISLTQSGFYDGLNFHRIEAVVIQGGDPMGMGIGNPGYSIKGEFKSNGHSANTLSHTRGVLSMARSRDYDSAGSQFFVVVQDFPSWDGEYAAFGQVIEGLEVVDGIVDGTVSDVIRSVTADTFGVDWPEPETIK